jgi:hypothetical protein
MPDLSAADVQGLLAAIGLQAVDAGDLEEVAHRLNAIREALRELDTDGLDAEAPQIAFGPEQARS